MNSPAVLGILLAFGICVVLPVCGIVAWVIAEGRKARLRHEERLAMIERGIAPPADGAEPPPAQVRTESRMDVGRDDVARGMGWAIGFLVAGVLWLATDLDRFGIMLVALGAAYLARGIIGLSRGVRAGGPPGGVR